MTTTNQPILDLLITKPTGKQVKLLLLLGLVIFAAIYPFMGYFFMMSGDTTNMIASQLSFSGSFLKDQYSTIMILGDLASYAIAQSLDYGFMVSYGILGFSLALLIGRKFQTGSSWLKSGMVIAILSPISACMDAVENAFILVTLLEPLTFQDWLAVAHSCFALAKWVLLLVMVGWAAVAAATLLVKRLKK